MSWSELKSKCSVVIIVLIALGQIQLLDNRYSLQPETTIPQDMSIYVITIWPHTYHPIGHCAWFFTGLFNSNCRGFLLMLNEKLPSKTFNSVTVCHLGSKCYVTLRYNEHFVS